ncbi:lysozyme C-like [Chiloscyllium plagiosum]|uniref:lysozyme C-like n=1 Tax=Chiloscyllium plagiosum TaxID=36176 RepID=UPI001CB7E418|nr:lysozyme C-like [Chiloscyllium plagiosum]
MKTFVALSLLLTATGAVIFEKCEVGKIFKENGLDGYLGYNLGDWVCLVDNESGFNTIKTVFHWTEYMTRKVTKYGIFQISDDKWCGNSDNYVPYRRCRVSCDSLMDGDLTDDIRCAKYIATTENGIETWLSWRKYCKGVNFNHFLDNCQL